MTNEEMAVAVKAGQADILTLWAQVRRFAMKKALRMERAVGVRGGVTSEDLLQSGFLALMDTLERWDTESGYTFISYFSTCLKTAFSACCGMRSTKQDQDPLRGCVSLNRPAIPDDPNSETLGDLVPDPAAEFAIEDIAERDRLDRLRAVIKDALAQLPEEQQAAIRDRYWYDKPVDHKTLQAALRRLRHPSISRVLMGIW